LITEAAYASGNDALIQTVDTIWEIIQALKTVETHEGIAMTSVAIVIRALKLQRDGAYQTIEQLARRTRKGA